MNISGVNNPLEVYNLQASHADKQKLKRAQAQKDSLALSDQAKDYQKVMNALKDVPDVREDVVQEIKEKLQSGTYNVSAEEVCNKILSGFDAWT